MVQLDFGIFHVVIS
jgi:hypothetical protein